MLMFPVVLSIDWNAVAAISGALAALAAFLTVLTTVSQWNATQEARRKERQADYANEWIVRRVHEGIDRFLEVVVPTVQSGIQEINQLRERNASISAVESKVEALIDGFEPEYFKVRRIIRLRVNGTLSQASAESIAKALDEVQDSFTKAFEKTPKRLKDDEIVAVLETSCSNLLRIVVKEAVDCW